MESMGIGASEPHRSGSRFAFLKAMYDEDEAKMSSFLAFK